MCKAGWLGEKKWGVMVHWLHDQKEYSQGNLFEPEITWEECVNGFDVKTFAETLHSLNAGYLIFTVMQGDRYMCAPNEAFDKIAGYTPGEACSRRDLIAEIANELETYGIKLILYFTGDGPYKDKQAGNAFGIRSGELSAERLPVSRDFVRKWASVLEEYAVRYGDKVSGWWIDGCYSHLGYCDELLGIYKQAIQNGNPGAIAAFNNGVYRPTDDDAFRKEVFENPRIAGNLLAVADVISQKTGVERNSLLCRPGPERYSKHDDFTAGEEDDFEFYPSEYRSEDLQWHILSFLGLPTFDGREFGKQGWSNFGCKYSGKELRNYVDKVNSLGGAVSVEVKIFRNGSLEKGQLETLKCLSDINK